MRRHLRRGLILGLSSATLGLGACGDGKSSEPVMEGVGMASPALAIIHSDYATSRVSLYRPTDGRLVDACTGSTSGDLGLTQALSGDVSLPTQAQVGGELVLIDSSSSVLTFLDPATCAVRAQLSVSTGGFKAYPHDVVTVSATKAYVTRNARNDKATVDPSDFDDGEDLLIVDPTALTVVGRIPLSAYATPDATGGATQAKPDGAVLVNGTVYVTLNNINGTFSAMGPGRVVAINTATDTVTGMIDLPGKDCGGLTYVAASKHLYVSCGGDFTALDQLAESALIEIDLSPAVPAVRKIITAATLGTAPVNYGSNVVLSDAAYVGTMGTIGDAKFGTVDAPDSFYRVSLATGVATLVAEGAAYNLGGAAVDKGTGRVFLPDADAATPRIRVFTAEGAPVANADFESNPSAHLPPRGLSWY